MTLHVTLAHPRDASRDAFGPRCAVDVTFLIARAGRHAVGSSKSDVTPNNERLGWDHERALGKFNGPGLREDALLRYEFVLARRPSP